MNQQFPTFPRMVIHPDDMARVRAYMDMTATECRRILDMCVPVLGAYMTELSRTLRDLVESTEHIRSTSTPTRPAWQSPHGPAHRKRTR